MFKADAAWPKLSFTSPCPPSFWTLYDEIIACYASAADGAYVINDSIASIVDGHCTRSWARGVRIQDELRQVIQRVCR